MITSIGHLAFSVRDMDKSLAFYCDVLGLKKAFTLEREGKPWIIYLKVADGQFIELFYGYEGGPVKGSYQHLSLLVEDIHQVSKRLEEKGYPIDSMPKQAMDDNWQCWAMDPDGNRIEFMQIMPTSPQAKA